MHRVSEELSSVGFIQSELSRNLRELFSFVSDLELIDFVFLSVEDPLVIARKVC